ncbi:hypothetical protein OSB04_028940 [Centaurea solstitialis]|uniref:Retrovirus-related Pol polyprotein from transposon TNT 1-94-like beta-barrel domain-containing protein n=1 Tax=Centaurea solstitialis TaxID=347529 RepID=A0AA38W9T4_9ASTR|nr:hypothetical protein OSB04_028940 [Centaurea solstitialis]
MVEILPGKEEQSLEKTVEEIDPVVAEPPPPKAVPIEPLNEANLVVTETELSEPDLAPIPKVTESEPTKEILEPSKSLKVMTVNIKEEVSIAPKVLDQTTPTPMKAINSFHSFELDEVSLVWRRSQLYPLELEVNPGSSSFQVGVTDTDQFPSVFKIFRKFRKKRKRVRKKRRSRRNFAMRGPISRHEPIADNKFYLLFYLRFTLLNVLSFGFDACRSVPRFPPRHFSAVSDPLSRHYPPPSARLNQHQPLPISWLGLKATSCSFMLFMAVLHHQWHSRLTPTGSPSPSRGRGGRFSHAPNNVSGRGGWGRGHRPPHCQLCRQDGHYANTRLRLASYATQAISSDNNLASPFLTQCHVSSSGLDWYVDSGATYHMTPSTQTVTNPSSTTGNNSVTFGNGNTLPITHKGHSFIYDNIKLNDILVVPNLTKSLLSISKLTKDNYIDALLSYHSFYIQDRQTKLGRCENGLYVLQTGHPALVASSSRPEACFEVWYSHLVHVHFDTIVNLQKLGYLFVSALLPKLGTCLPCHLAKS